MMECSLLLTDAGEIVTVAAETSAMEVSRAPLRRWRDAAVAVRGDRIVDVGPSGELVSRWRAERVVSAKGHAVTPAFVDPHTHLACAGSRREEFAARVRGVSLPPGLGGGIAETVRATTACEDGELASALAGRLRHWVGSGTTLIECKSGYGLTVEGEVRLLEQIRDTAEQQRSAEVVGTLLAAHALPAAYAGRETAYLEEVAWPAAVAAAERGLAEYVDVFIEDGAFTAAAAEAYLRRCRTLGLRSRVHADQFTRSGGTRVAVRVGAASVDHLEQAGSEEVELLSGSGVTAILCPGAVLTVEGRGGARPPARHLIAAGVPVALATDYNPGTSNQPAPSLTPALAARLFGMTPDETLAGVTAAAAHSLGRGDRLGRIAPGYQADLCVWQVAAADDLSYELAEHLPDHVFVRGREVGRDGRAAD